MDDYKPNSNLSKRQGKDEVKEKKVERIVSSDVKLKKKNCFQRMASTFINNDAENVGVYLLENVLVPALQNTLLSFITTGSEMMILGSSARRDAKKSPGSFVSYRGYYDSRRDDPRDRREIRSAGFEVDDIILDSREDAEAVLMRMDEIMDKYDGIATVLDLYDLVGAPAPHTAQKYGWTSLRNASVERVRDGYILRLPRPMAID